MTTDEMAGAVIDALAKVRVCNILGYTGPYSRDGVFSMQVCQKRHWPAVHFMVSLVDVPQRGNQDHNWFLISGSHLQNECP